MVTKILIYNNGRARDKLGNDINKPEYILTSSWGYRTQIYLR